MATLTLPARCAVAVICGDHLVSQVYPAAIPIEVFFDNVVELLNEDLRRRGLPGLDSGAAYELQRANGGRLDITRTLDDLGIEDGMTLVLAPAEEGEAFEPQCESLATSLAGAGKKHFKPVTAETAVQTSLAILAMIVATVLGLAIHTRFRVDAFLPGVITTAAGVLLGAGAVTIWRWWPRSSDLRNALVWIAVPLLAGGITLSVPGELNAAHVFIAALMVAVLTAVAVVMTRRLTTPAAAVIALSGVVGLIAAVRTLTGATTHQLGVGALMILLVLLTVCPTFALWAARIRPPHFGSITGRDVFRRGDGMPTDVVAPVDDEDDEAETDTTPSGARIAEAALRAGAVITGMCAAAAVALPAAIWAAVAPGGPHPYATGVLALLLVLIFISRARAFSDRRPAVALVCGAVAGFCAAVVRYMIGAPGGSFALMAAVVVLMGFAGAGLAAALVVPATRFTPLVRMVVEWLELVAVVVVLPLAAWIIGLFAWVRMR